MLKINKQNLFKHIVNGYFYVFYIATQKTTKIPGIFFYETNNRVKYNTPSKKNIPIYPGNYRRLILE